MFLEEIILKQHQYILKQFKLSGYSSLELSGRCFLFQLSFSQKFLQIQVLHRWDTNVDWY